MLRQADPDRVGPRVHHPWVFRGERLSVGVRTPRGIGPESAEAKRQRLAFRLRVAKVIPCLGNAASFGLHVIKRT